MPRADEVVTAPPAGPSLAQQRKNAALRMAQAAGADLAASRYDDAMAHAGIALEHLLKAFLAEQHPLLVVDSPGGKLNISGMRWALGREPILPRAMRTITAREALDRCRGLLPELDARSLEFVLQARNGALHVGQSDAAAGEVVASVAQASELLLPALGLDTRWLWGHYFDAVMGRLDKQRTEVANRVADRIAQARDEFEVRFKKLGVDGIQALHSLGSSYSFADDETAEACPVCNAPGVVAGRIELEEEGQESELTNDHNDWSLSSSPLVTFLTPERFRCRSCGLWFEGASELRAANIGTERRPIRITLDFSGLDDDTDEPLL